MLIEHVAVQIKILWILSPQSQRQLERHSRKQSWHVFKGRYWIGPNFSSLGQDKLSDVKFLEFMYNNFLTEIDKFQSLNHMEEEVAGSQAVSSDSSTKDHQVGHILVLSFLVPKSQMPWLPHFAVFGRIIQKHVFRRWRGSDIFWVWVKGFRCGLPKICHWGTWMI